MSENSAGRDDKKLKILAELLVLGLPSEEADYIVDDIKPGMSVKSYLEKRAAFRQRILGETTVFPWMTQNKRSRSENID